MANPDMRSMEDHYPHRGDQVEAWIKDRRDAMASAFGSVTPYDSLDELLDEYRLAADTGQSLENVVNGEPEDVPPVHRERKPAREAITRREYRDMEDRG